MSVVNYREMGQRIKSIRLKQKLTQEKLADRVGISVSFVGMIERGDKIASLETIVKLSRALDVDMDFLVLGNASPRELYLLEEMKRIIQTYERKDLLNKELFTR